MSKFTVSGGEILLKWSVRPRVRLSSFPCEHCMPSLTLDCLVDSRALNCDWRLESVWVLERFVRNQKLLVFAA